MQARAKTRSLHLNDRTNHQSLKAAIDGSTFTPLLCLLRDQAGPRGEATGTYSTQPKEVDEITQRAWGDIYRGNIIHKHALAESFVIKHVPAVSTDEEFSLGPMTGMEHNAECLNARKPAGGLDHFEPADFALLTDKEFEKLAALLNAIEDGADWPEDVATARAAFLAKECRQVTS